MAEAIVSGLIGAALSAFWWRVGWRTGYRDGKVYMANYIAERDRGAT